MKYYNKRDFIKILSIIEYNYIITKESILNIIIKRF